MLIERDFLREAGFEGAQRWSIKGDCSTRVFSRLEKKGRRAVLMQAAKDQKTPAFLAIDRLLRQAGLHAPEIYAVSQDETGALVLMEDLGETLLSDRLIAGQESLPLDACVVEALAQLHEKIKVADLAGLGLTDFTAQEFARQAALCLDYYVVPRFGALDEGAYASFHEAWLKVLEPLDALPRVLILRDFIADNIVDLGGNGAARIGFIDFQDGGAGPVAYDLMSYCEEVRRDSGAARWQRVFDGYRALCPVLDRATLEQTGRLLSVQRHVRLLGNRALQAQHRILDRLEAHVIGLLKDEAMASVRAWFAERGLLGG